MGALRHRLMRTGHRIGVWSHHPARGRLDSRGRATVLMVTSPGRGRVARSRLRCCTRSWVSRRA